MLHSFDGIATTTLKQQTMKAAKNLTDEGVKTPSGPSVNSDSTRKTVGHGDSITKGRTA